MWPLSIEGAIRLAEKMARQESRNTVKVEPWRKRHRKHRGGI